jgi:hypothetical protein
MPKVKLIRGIVWDGEPKSPGDLIECSKRQVEWLKGRKACVEVVEDVIVPADAVEPKPKRKYTKRKKEEE